MDSCKPMLYSIKCKLGDNNEKYISTSSAVIYTGINAIIDIVDYWEDKFNPKVPGFVMLREIPLIKDELLNNDNHKKIIESNIESLKYLGSLDMDDKCRKYYTETLRTLKRIYGQLQPVSKPNSDGCYIATMAYEDYDHPQVLVLRNFRDNFLKRREWGKRFIKFYYAHSPYWVEKLKHHNIVNFIIRKVLDSFVYIWKIISK